jgi:hypothetical protein
MKISDQPRAHRPRAEDELLWTELHEGECVCPHVRQGVIRLDPKLCLCGEMGAAARRAARAPPRHGRDGGVGGDGRANCVYRISLGERCRPAPA